MNIHVYTAPLQPATGFNDYTFEPPMEFSFKPRKLVFARCCGRRRLAQNCVVQCYYDGMDVWCARGKGCKSEKGKEAKRSREFRNRSRAQKARWAREKTA